MGKPNLNSPKLRRALLVLFVLPLPLLLILALAASPGSVGSEDASAAELPRVELPANPYDKALLQIVDDQPPLVSDIVYDDINDVLHAVISDLDTGNSPIIEEA